MTNRWRLWLGASVLALASGALPAFQIASPIAAATLGIDLPGDAWAQESGEDDGEGTDAECTTEDGEGDEGGAADCGPSGEDGEGEG